MYGDGNGCPMGTGVATGADPGDGEVMGERKGGGGGLLEMGGTPGMVGGTPRNGGRLHEKPWGLKGQWERMGVGSGRGAWG